MSLSLSASPSHMIPFYVRIVSLLRERFPISPLFDIFYPLKFDMDHGRRRLHSGSTPRGGERPAKRERISVEEQQSQEIRNLKRKLEEARQREDKYIKNEQLHHTAMRSKQQRIERMEKSMESTNRLVLEIRVIVMECF